MNYKQFTGVITSNANTWTVYIDQSGVNYVQGSRKDQVGDAILSLHGSTTMAVMESLESVIDAFPGLVAAVTHDTGERPTFDNQPVYINPLQTLMVTPSGNFWKVRFRDGDELYIKNKPSFL